MEATKFSNIRALVFRFFNVAMSESLINPYSGEDLLSTLKYCTQKGKTFLIFGKDYNTLDGTCYRDFIHISDLLDALILGEKYLQTSTQSFSLFNLGSGSGISLSQIAYLGKEILADQFNFEYTTRRRGDVAFSLADISASVSSLGWGPKVEAKSLFESFFESLKSRGD
jgi:UDP-glucose 4-epimerase